MTRIVRTHYRYKRPPRKRKAVALKVPAVVAAKKPKVGKTATAKPEAEPAIASAIVKPPRKYSASPANDGRNLQDAASPTYAMGTAPIGSRS